MIPRALYLLAAALASAVMLLGTPTAAQFGIPKKAQDIAERLQASSEAAVGADGSASQNQDGFLSSKDAGDMEELIKKAKADPQTREMIGKMRAEMGDELKSLGTESQEQILGGMKQALDEIKMLDYLFKDKARAVREMEKEGMIPDKKKLKLYKKDPDLLESDTRKGLYFQFVSLAVAGGFM